MAQLSAAHLRSRLCNSSSLTLTARPACLQVDELLQLDSSNEEYQELATRCCSALPLCTTCVICGARCPAGALLRDAIQCSNRCNTSTPRALTLLSCILLAAWQRPSN